MGAEPFRHGRWRTWTPLVVHAVTVQAFVTAVRPTVSYNALDSGVAPALLGMLSAAYAFAPLLLALPAGHLVDRVGERPVLLAGSTGLVASSAVLLTAPPLAGWLAIGLVLAGVGHLLCMTGEQTAVAKMSHEASDSRFGTYTLASSAGQAVGPLLLMLGTGTRLLAATLVLAAVATVASLWVNSHRARTSRSVSGSVLPLLRDRMVRRAVVVSGIVMAAVDLTLVYLPALGVEVGFSAAFVGVVLAVRAGASMAIRLFTGWVIGLVGRRVALVAGMAMAAAGFVVAAFIHQPAAWLIAAVTLGAGLGLAQPITMAAVADEAPLDRRGTAMTLRLMSNRLSVVVIPGSIGAVAAAAGPAGVLVATAGILAVGCVAWGRR